MANNNEKERTDRQGEREPGGSQKGRSESENTEPIDTATEDRQHGQTE